MQFLCFVNRVLCVNLSSFFDFPSLFVNIYACCQHKSVFIMNHV